MTFEMVCMLAVGFVCGVAFGSIGQHEKYVDGYLKGIKDSKEMINGRGENDENKRL